MGVYDIPAVYEYILRKVKIERSSIKFLQNKSIKKKLNNSEQKIIYFGHSQGTSQMFAGLTDSKSSDFLHKHTKFFIASAPIAYLNHVESSALKYIAGMEEYKKWAFMSPILGLAK